MQYRCQKCGSDVSDNYNEAYSVDFLCQKHWEEEYEDWGRTSYYDSLED